MTNKWQVVMPTYRVEEFNKFLTAWLPLFRKHDVHLHVMVDHPAASQECLDICVKLEAQPLLYSVYSHDTIKQELGAYEWIIPKKTDCIRSFGFYKAWQMNGQYTLTLDDDVRPIEGFDVFEAYERQFEEGAIVSNYFNVGELIERPKGLFMRGFPFKDRQPKKVMLQYGMWAGVPDLDGVTQLQNPTNDAKVFARNVTVPLGATVTGCIMNCAFRREFTPYFYQLLMGKDWPYDRWGDIWSGLIAKRICDNNDWAVVVNGNATVQHLRASDVTANIKKEASGYIVNEEINEWIDRVLSNDYDGVMRHLTRNDAFYNTEYSEKLATAVQVWTKLFEQR